MTSTDHFHGNPRKLNAFARQDRSRRRLGEQMDALGWGPRESPSRQVFHAPCVTLKGYGAATGGPVVLLVPAPIKRAYLWDLAPWASVVRRCLDAGLRVYLLQWEAPGEEERGFGLADYADRLILDCLEAIRAETERSSAFLIGHSLGGTCAALFAALHPERVDGLVLLGSPLHFGPDVGLFEEVVEQLYREDRFMRGTLKIGGASAAPAQVTAPLLSLVDRHCEVAPPAAMLPFHHAARSRAKKLLWYPGDVGVSLRHVGMLVGRNAHRRLWPAIIGWMKSRAEEGAAGYSA